MAKFAIPRAFFIALTVVTVAAARAQNENWSRRSVSDCTTPSGLQGICVLLARCQSLRDLQKARPLSKGSARFLVASQCLPSTGDLNGVKVCCPIDSDLLRNGRSVEENPAVLSSRNNSILPSDCGSDVSKRIVGGEITDLDEFPWMALLEYDSPRGKRTGCGGVVVSSRYVLTAAHCADSEALPKSWSLSNVRLGEYDISRDLDCVSDDNDGSEVCSEAPVSVAVEEKIVHESYVPKSVDRQHDVALLRLAQHVRFTDYVKPICLPSSGNLARKLWIAGWGKTESRTQSNVKLKLSMSLANKSACSQKYKEVGIHLREEQLCVGGETRKDSCRGDSGGPLMSLERAPDGKRKWTVVGIISFGPEPCGTRHWPGVYVKVADYLPWILAKVRS
ncbi:CLIP domain-containing serine protease 2-like [Venturia canescens]|uniref:CLIP domain-containing serine protease 2-like n=1 Tax=Venturia canescens TaxID=32260 RepID=UPI001C9C29AB|nr:CLIP domain-containing serine protease 2-like [Venturia canescens]